MGIFDKRERIQPYEYPHMIGYAKAIQHAFWEVDHFVYDRDVKDFKTKLKSHEKTAIKRFMLAIGVVENKVKSFWSSIYNRMPKTEISDVGFTFAGNEVIHRMAYAELLKLLGLEEEFEHVLEIPCIKDRVNYLNKYLDGVNSRSNKEFTKSLILFVLLMENASLFTQFLGISSFSKYRNLLKNFSKVINATAREEILHGKFGSELINIIRTENPDWFDDEMEEKIRRAIRKAYESEEKVLDWILEEGEIEQISKAEILEYLKLRLNDSLNQIGYKDEYVLDTELLKKSEYMEVMLNSTKTSDFFDGKLTDYNESKPITDESLWD